MIFYNRDFMGKKTKPKKKKKLGKTFFVAAVTTTTSYIITITVDNEARFSLVRHTYTLCIRQGSSADIWSDINNAHTLRARNGVRERGTFLMKNKRKKNNKAIIVHLRSQRCTYRGEKELLRICFYRFVISCRDLIIYCEHKIIGCRSVQIRTFVLAPKVFYCITINNKTYILL